MGNHMDNEMETGGIYGFGELCWGNRVNYSINIPTMVT